MISAALLLLILAQDFSTQIKPILEANCVACHNPSNPRNRANFLKAADATDVETRRNLWRNVATQLRNRTMPPTASKLTESDRLLVSTWIDERLRKTGCQAGPGQSGYAGYVAPRRLNRREYKNTVRDLLGLDLPIADLFPADESGGAGFDTNGETLFLPPMMLERYMESARTIAERVVITPPVNRLLLSHELEPLTPAPPANAKPRRVLEPLQEVSTTATIYAEGPYNLRVNFERPPLAPFTVEVLVDGNPIGKLNYQRDSAGGATVRVQVAELTRGQHKISIRNGEQRTDFYGLTIEQKVAPPSAERRALHYRLLGLEAGETPVHPRRAAERLFTRLLPRAYRQPLEEAELARILALYDRSAQRGDPFEESIKLALKAVLVSPKFLFRVENPSQQAGPQALNSYAMASRLSYFLWSSMPDEELLRLAAEGRLQDEKVLRAQLERMLDDPRSRAFSNAFVGQWLGTQEIGGRAVPLLTELQHFYTPEVAADLREQPSLFFHHILSENRSLLELIDGNYTFLTERLARYYEVEKQIPPLAAPGFQKVTWPDTRRAGVLGLASVLAMTSHYKEASPVLRGAWVLDTLLGTPVPPPPPDVPALAEAAKGSPKKLTVREMLAMHRANQACAACHNLMDPYGLALENFDWMGRWRENEIDGSPVNASAVLPTGEKLEGAAGLRAVLMNHKEEFLRHLSTKLLGYALGRGIQDGDQCTMERFVGNLSKNNYSARSLLADIVLSAPFRQSQVDAPVSEIHSPASKKAPRRLLGTK